MIIKTGFLLSYIKYGDNDAIVHCYTRNFGYESYFIKGVYSKNNKKKAYLNPLNQLEFDIVERRKSSMQTAAKLQLINHVSQPNIQQSSVLFFIADFLNQILREEDFSEEIYASISTFIKEVEDNNYQAHLIFLLSMIKNLGFSPLIGEYDFFNPLTGSFERQMAHNLFDREISNLWKEALVADEEYSMKIRNHLKKRMLNSIIFYLEIHLPNFKKLVSWDVLQQIFND